MAAIRKNATEEDVQNLKSLLAKTAAKVFGPRDEGYGASILRWSRAAERPAGVSTVPTTASEVSVAVKYAHDRNLDLAVKGGGHSTAGASSTNGGVLIDLSEMRSVRVDPERNLLYVPGGCVWSDVDEAAWKHRLATVGGTVCDTGVGGLTLGGGYGHLTGKYGLVIDNLVEATVVLANGEIVKASEDQNSDLFWALRGAGQNFGVTTEFVLRAYPQDDVYTGMMVFKPTPENIGKIVDAVNDLYQIRVTPFGPATKGNGQCATLMAVVKPPAAGGKTMVLLLCTFFGGETEGRAAFKPFSDIGPVTNTMGMHPYTKVNTLVPATIGMRSSVKGAAFMLPIRPEFVQDMIDEFDRSLATLADGDLATSLVAWELHDAVKMAELEGGCFANRGYHLNAIVRSTWSKEQNDQIGRQWGRDMAGMSKKELQSQGQETGRSASRRGPKGAVMMYGNYDQDEERSKDIFGVNYQRLQEVKAKYDPTNMFNRMFPITPAVSEKQESPYRLLPSLSSAKLGGKLGVIATACTALALIGTVQMCYGWHFSLSRSSSRIWS